MEKRPAVVVVASWLLWGLVAAGALVMVAVFAFQDQIAEVWSPEQGGDSRVQPLDFLPVILVLYLVTAATAIFLIPLLRHGHNWARLSLAVLAGGILLCTFAVGETEPPAVIRWSAIGAAMLAAVTLVFLLHVEARKFCRTPDPAT